MSADSDPKAVRDTKEEQTKKEVGFAKIRCITTSISGHYIYVIGCHEAVYSWLLACMLINGIVQNTPLSHAQLNPV